MIDVSGSSLAELLDRDDDSALTACLRRLNADIDGPSEPIAGFNSAL
ncbi:FxSxx-COOH cyclophane-containing RiPP peptide [Actinoplanes sp. NPDC051851]